MPGALQRPVAAALPGFPPTCRPGTAAQHLHKRATTCAAHPPLLAALNLPLPCCDPAASCVGAGKENPARQFHRCPVAILQPVWGGDEGQRGAAAAACRAEDGFLPGVGVGAGARAGGAALRFPQQFGGGRSAALGAVLAVVPCWGRACRRPPAGRRDALSCPAHETTAGPHSTARQRGPRRWHAASPRLSGCPRTALPLLPSAAVVGRCGRGGEGGGGSDLPPHPVPSAHPQLRILFADRSILCVSPQWWATS